MRWVTAPRVLALSTALAIALLDGMTYLTSDHDTPIWTHLVWVCKSYPLIPSAGVVLILLLFWSKPNQDGSLLDRK